MTRRIILSLTCFLLLAPCFGKGIKGKYSCSDQTVDQMSFGFDDLWCTYKFKKNGTFVLTIKGETPILSALNHGCIFLFKGTIILKGQYEIKDGRITSTVENKDVKTYAELPHDIPTEISGVDQHGTEHLRSAGDTNSVYDFYDSYEKPRAVLLRKDLLVHRYMWDWDNIPITITGNELKIGEQLLLQRR